MVSTVASFISEKFTLLGSVGFTYYKFLMNRNEYYTLLNHNNDPGFFLSKLVNS